MNKEDIFRYLSLKLGAWHTLLQNMLLIDTNLLFPVHREVEFVLPQISKRFWENPFQLGKAVTRGLLRPLFGKKGQKGQDGDKGIKFNHMILENCFDLLGIFAPERM